MRTFVVMVALIAILSGDASTTVIRVQAAGWSFGVQRQLLHDSVVEVNCPGIAASICTRATRSTICFRARLDSGSQTVL